MPSDMLFACANLTVIFCVASVSQNFHVLETASKQQSRKQLLYSERQMTH